jgi:hypothetical protein
MRALCGAIITAGALIGLGLTAVGYGQRYGTTTYGTSTRTGDSQHVVLHLGQVDGTLLFLLVFLTCVAIVGIGIAFLGLAYHHHHREREHLLHRTQAGIR